MEKFISNAVGAGTIQCNHHDACVAASSIQVKFTLPDKISVSAQCGSYSHPESFGSSQYHLNIRRKG